MGGNTSKNQPQNSVNNSPTGARFAAVNPDYDVFIKDKTVVDETQIQHQQPQPSFLPKFPPNQPPELKPKGEHESDSGGELYANLEDIISTLKTMMDSDTSVNKQQNTAHPNNQVMRNHTNGGRITSSSGSEDISKVPNNTPNNENANFTPSIESLLKQHKMLMEAVLQRHLTTQNASNSTSSLDSSLNAASTESYMFDSGSLDSSNVTAAVDAIPMGATAKHLKHSNKQKREFEMLEEYDNITKTLKQLCGEDGYMVLARKNDELLRKEYEGTYIDSMYESVATLMQAVRESAEKEGRHHHDLKLEAIVAKHASVVMPSNKQPMTTKPTLKSSQLHTQPPNSKPILKPPVVLRHSNSQSNALHNKMRNLSVNSDASTQHEFTNPVFYNSTSSLTTDSGSYSFSPSGNHQPSDNTPYSDAIASLWQNQLPKTNNIWSHPTDLSQPQTFSSSHINSNLPNLATFSYPPPTQVFHSLTFSHFYLFTFLFILSCGLFSSYQL